MNFSYIIEIATLGAIFYFWNKRQDFWKLYYFYISMVLGMKWSWLVLGFKHSLVDTWCVLHSWDFTRLCDWKTQLNNKGWNFLHNAHNQMGGRKQVKKLRHLELGFTILPPFRHRYPRVIKAIMTTDKKKVLTLDGTDSLVDNYFFTRWLKECSIFFRKDLGDIRI